MEDTTAPEVTPIAGGDAETQAETQTLGWKTELPESIRGNEVFAPYKTKNELWNGHIEAVNKVKDLESKLDNAILKPAENATPEEKEAYYRSLGKPEKPEEYELPEKEGLPNDPNMVAWAQKTFHAANLTKEQARVVGDNWNEFMGSLRQAQEAINKEATEKAAAEIKQEWGAKFEENSVIAAKVAEKLVEGKEGQKWLIAQDDPMLLRLLFAAAPAFLPDTAPPGSRSGSGPSIGMNYET